MVTNADLEALVDTTDAWIYERTIADLAPGRWPPDAAPSPRPRTAPSVPATRLRRAHENLTVLTRSALELTERSKDWGSNDLLMGDVLRRNELQVWFIAHLVDVPLVEH